MPTELFTTIVVFAVALFFLIKSADYFVIYSEKVGLALGVPQFIIGVTIVSAGTSLPELVTSLISVAKGDTGFVAGNVIGSNIANILLIVGITTIIAKRVEIKKSLIRLDLPLLVGSGAILVLTMQDGVFTFIEAVLSILGFLVYILYNVSEHRQSLVEKEKDLRKIMNIEKKPVFKWYFPVIILVSTVVLYISAEYTINSVISLSGFLNIDTAVIAITAVAVGTSLPELLVSVVAARKGNFDMSLGNILGSNIFNGFMVMGIPGLMHDLEIPDSVLVIGVPFFIIATIFLVFSGIERKFYNFEGALYLILYFLFIGNLFHFI